MGLLKKFKRAVKKITKPVSRFLDKVVPNEIKPFLPYAAAAVPFLAPASGVFASMAGRAALSGGSNLLAQLAQEGSEGDFSGLSALLAAGTGALAAPGDAARGTQSASDFLKGKTAGMDTGLVKSGLEGLGSMSEGLQKTGDILRPGGLKPEGIMDLGKAALPAFTQGSVDLGMATARKALKDYEDELAEYERMTGEAQTASDEARRSAIIAAMTAGQHSQDVIDETLALLGLKDGGRVGLREGGVLAQILPQQQPELGFQPFMGRPAFQPLRQAQAVFPRLNQLEQGVNKAEETLGRIRSKLGAEQTGQLTALQPAMGVQTPLNMLSILQQRNDLAQGMKDGGIMNLGGKEMDLRGGGFVPIGKKERADDVPARLSKNEFVMTADAVRAAGGGDVNEGARRMYETMNRLEARA
jgi:hypothetical protein